MTTDEYIPGLMALAAPVLGRFKVPERQRVLFAEEKDPPRRVNRRVRQLVRWHNVDPDDSAARASTEILRADRSEPRSGVNRPAWLA